MPLTQVPGAMMQDQGVTPQQLSQPLTRGTAVASTSGTSIDLTGIPSWAKRVTLMLNQISTASTAANFLVQLGTASGVETTAYVNFSGWMNSAAATGANNTATGYVLPNWGAAVVLSGSLVFTLVGSNTWTCMGVVASSSGGGYVGGSKTLAGVLDRLRVTTIGGTDTFDAGSINIMYE